MSTETTTVDNTAETKILEKTEMSCFIIMPISDQLHYEAGHFTNVYRDIIAPACIQAGFKPVRADENKGTNIIQYEILQQLLSAELAICDLSSRNPNVMFELGLRQAFDKPTVLIQDELTPQIFDISMLRYTTYRSKRLYNEVVEDQKNIRDAILQTSEEYKMGKSTNSLVRLLSINKAVLNSENISDVEKGALSILQMQMSDIYSEIKRLGRKDELPERLKIKKYPNDALYLNEDEIFILKNYKIASNYSLIFSLTNFYTDILHERIFNDNLSMSVFKKYSEIKGVPEIDILNGYNDTVKELANKIRELYTPPR